MKKNILFLLPVLTLIVLFNACKKNAGVGNSSTGGTITLISPSDSTKFIADSITFNWYGNPGQSYTITIADATTTGVVLSRNVISASSFTHMDFTCQTGILTIGHIYHWQITTPGFTSPIYTFYYLDPANIITGNWTGRWHSWSWVGMGGTPHDTTYTTTINLTVFSGTSLTINQSSYLAQTYTSPVLFGYLNLPPCGGTHNGAFFYFDSLYHKLTYASSSGGLGGCGIDSFFAVR